jgi:hypothetical protein
LPRQGRHVVEGSYEKEASRRKHKQDCHDRTGIAEGSYEKEASRRKHKEDCHDRAGMLKRAATRRKPEGRSIRLRLP